MNKYIIYFIIALLLMIILNLTINSIDLFYILIVTTLYLIFITSFKHLKYTRKTPNHLFSSIILIILINIIYFIITYIISSLFFNNIKIIFIAMASTIFIIPSTKLICEYLTNNNQKKKNNIIKLIFYLFGIITVITLIILYHFINLNINIFGLILFLSLLIPFIITIIYQRKILKFNKINKKEIKQIFTTNIRESLILLSNLAYYYLSLMFLYFSLTKQYLYDLNTVSSLLIDVYFYSYAIVLFLSYLHYPKEKTNNLTKLNILIVKKMLPLAIFISILSGPILMLLLNNDTNSYVLMLLIFEAIFLVIYNVCIKLLIDKNNFNIVLIIGIIIKCITTIPLIKSLYRMGYSMVYGDILSTMLALFIPILITILYYNNKEKVVFADYFEDIISIVYENIILCLALILFQLIIPLNVDNRANAILVIITYACVYLLYTYFKIQYRRKK